MPVWICIEVHGLERGLRAYLRPENIIGVTDSGELPGVCAVFLSNGQTILTENIAQEIFRRIEGKDSSADYQQLLAA